MIELIKEWWGVILFFGGIGVLILFFYCGGSCDSKQGVNFSSPQGVTQKFVNAMGELNFDKMREYTKDNATVFVGNLEVQYSTLNSNEKEQFKALVKKAATTAKIKVSENKPEGNLVYAYLTNAEDSKAKTTLKLERKDSFSPWYITNISDN
ncbi:MAG: hypothetical protein IKD22_01360 [Lentisphaeria bacterium]|nr:hypothetical protein [Lentisphaeria bacterium]